ncbi:hypothetical protein [Rubrobacter calidifluminis]|uniref:hypothetical protein n=1 Tax=Rubrobacter calidifluminis TaxID=1392640 RepID=UPI002360DFDF|nr:hypothetical protein [Rubrobacter calidifluminis]
MIFPLITLIALFCVPATLLVLGCLEASGRASELERQKEEEYLSLEELWRRS